MEAGMPEIACVAIVRNEERHIAEWLAWQFALGFDRVLLLDNLSTDRTKDVALDIAGSRDVQVLDWPLRGADYQLRAYQFAMAHLEGRYDWVAFFDTDEFLVLDPGLTLKECLKARHEAAAVVIPWAIFGSSGHRTIPPGLIIENFLHRAPASFGPNRHVKSIVRAAQFRAVETVHSFVVDGPTILLDGREVVWASGGILHEAPDYRIGKLHHYFTRSWEHWTLKLRRGYPDTARRLEEFEAYDLNDVFDDAAVRLAPMVTTIVAQAAGNPPGAPPDRGSKTPPPNAETSAL